MDQQKISGFIAANRKAHGMTQAELAEHLGVTNKAVSKWETERCLPDAELFQPLCGLLGITVNELLTGERIPPEQAAEKAEATIVSLAEERQNRDHWKRLIKYAAFVTAWLNIVANLLCIVFPMVYEYRVLTIPYGILSLLTVLHMAFCGIAMETNRRDTLLQWLTLSLCIALPISAGFGIHALPSVSRTFSYAQVIRWGMPCMLLLGGLLPWIGPRSLFYLSFGLSALGLAVSIRNLAAIKMKKA